MEATTERTVKAEQILKVIGQISKWTLELYLKNWRFVPFERKVKSDMGWKIEYVYCKDFFNNLYTYLIMKRKIYAARNLKDTFAQVGMQLEYLED